MPREGGRHVRIVSAMYRHNETDGRERRLCTRRELHTGEGTGTGMISPETDLPAYRMPAVRAHRKAAQRHVGRCGVPQWNWETVRSLSAAVRREEKRRESCLHPSCQMHKRVRTQDIEFCRRRAKCSIAPNGHSTQCRPTCLMGSAMRAKF